MYAKEFEDLLNEYLTDGIITSKERQVLLKKAQQLGYDVDEVDLYIDAQQQRSDQEVEVAASKRRGKTCPYCGAPVPLLTDKCPQCGQEITPEASEEFTELMAQLDDALVELKKWAAVKGQGMNTGSVFSAFTGEAQREYNETCANYSEAKGNVENSLRKLKLFYSNNPKVKILVEEAEKELGSAKKDSDKQKRIALYALIALLVITAILFTALYFSGAYSENGNTSTDSIESVDGSTTQGAQGDLQKVSKFVKDGDLSEAKDYLMGLSYTSSIDLEKMTSAYVSVCNAYIKDDDYDSAEELGLDYKTKMDNDYSWSSTSLYSLLKTKFKSAGKDFATLKSSYDSDEN